MYCNQVCLTIKVKFNSKGTMYAPDVKKCNSCDTFVKVTPETIKCPCCNSRLRIKARSVRQRAKRNPKRY